MPSPGEPPAEKASDSPAVKASKLVLPPDATVGDAFRACLRSCLDDHLAPNEALFLKGRHMDNLHQTRVSWRRSRAAMSLFGPLLKHDERGQEIKIRMREIVLPLGPARDADVLLKRAVKEEWPARHTNPLRGRRRSTYAVAVALLRSPQWREMKADLRAWLEDPKWLDSARDLRDSPARVLTDAALAKRYLRVAHAGPFLATMAPHGLHRVRIEGKKLRYGCEFFESLYADAPGSTPAAFASALGEMQDAFGEANDIAVAVHTLSAHAIPTEHVEGRADRVHAIAAWEDVMELRPFWIPADVPTTAPDQIITARAVPLGGVRAITVHRTLPHRDRSTVGAWCFVDHYGPTPLDGAQGMDVPPHPHMGLQTVSWLFEGAIEHRDSGGGYGLVRPGEVNLMTSGRGICHSEVSTPDTRVLHGTQLWIALPRKALGVPRGFEHHTPERVVLDGGGSARVFVGSLSGLAKSPVTTYSPLVGAQIDLPPGAQARITVKHDFEHALLVDTGELRLGDVVLGPGDLGVYDRGRKSLRIDPGPDGARLLLLGGEPFGEKIVMWWNLIGRSHDDIVAARRSWEADEARFGAVEGYAGPVTRLPAPELPHVRLRPR
ncbi:MAG: CHAD domain-containing protein [Dermatophilaceae bacterium]